METPFKVIKTEAEYRSALARFETLLEVEEEHRSLDDLELLSVLIEKYEDEHVEMPHVSDATMLRSLMDEKGIRQIDVVRGTGISKTVLSLVLNGKRDLTREHIGTLSNYFGVNPSTFLGSD